MDANAYMFDSKKDDNHTPPSGPSSDGRSSAPDQTDPGTKRNQGTLIVDAICAPANIRCPQDISLLNEAREKLESIIFRSCKTYGLTFSRRYTRRAWKDYLVYAKCRKHTRKQTWKAIKKQLSYVRRDLEYVDRFMSEGYVPVKKEIPMLLTIMELYRQQQYMHDQKVHSVADRIVSIHQPWIRPIGRGKTKAATEFGAKLDVSIDESLLIKSQVFFEENFKNSI